MGMKMFVSRHLGHFAASVAMAAMIQLGSSCWAAEGAGDISMKLEKQLQPHPRLFLNADGEQELKNKIKNDPQLAAVHQHLSSNAEKLLDQPPVARIMQGRRMLMVSRRAMERIATLGLMFRVTGDKRFADRARVEMLAAAAFSDWNPSHFLDVGEMTAALAIGYDWLHGQLSESERVTIRNAIVQKGLHPSFEPGQHWHGATNNWVQVCHGGLTMGALAIAEDQRELAAKVITRTAETLPRATTQYQPDGVYPEGPGYWGYGTAYHVLLAAALESALGTDLGLAADPAVVKTPQFFLHCTGSSRQWFNYCDCGSRGTYAPPMWWFARRQNDPSLLFNERNLLESAIRRGDLASEGENARFLPFLLIWAPQEPATVMPTRTHFVGAGPTPVGFFRSAWTNDATWLAIKGGSPTVSHGHMDVGAFAIDALGVRWADDMGLQNYFTLETKGVDLWNFKPDSQRWQVFRISTAIHNVLMVDNKNQVTTATAPIARSGDRFAIVRLSDIYQGQLAKAQRGAMLRQDASVRIQDEIAGGASAAKVRWAFLTRATLAEAGDNRAVLTIGEKKMHLRLSGIHATFRSYSTRGPNSFDAENPGTQMVGFEYDLKPGENATFAVDFIPGESAVESPAIVPLEKW